MRLSSPAFNDGEQIPERYTAPNANELPPLHIESVPEAAASLALLLEDVDSPLGTVTHWLAWNLPPETVHIDNEGLPEGSCVGLDTFGEHGYLGPAPAEGRHHYRFRLLALDCVLELPDGAGRPEFDTAAADHLVQEADLTVFREATPGSPAA